MKMNLEELSKMSEKELIRLAKDSENGLSEKAFGVLYEKNSSGLYNYMYRFCRNKEESEDLVQEAFIKAYNAIDGFDCKYAFSTWLHRIAINNAIDTFKKKRIRTVDIDSLIYTSIPGKNKLVEISYSPKIFQNFEDLNIKNILKEDIENLPPKDGEAILFRYTKEKSYEEIAGIFDIPLGTVKSRIFRARKLLGKKVKKRLEEQPFKINY